MRCKECKAHPLIPNIRGDGRCKKHGRYWMGWRDQPCPVCAREKGLCDRCGKLMEEERLP